MPTYEYVCEKCGHEFEISQSMTQPALTQCPKELCAKKQWGKGKVKKLIGSGAGLIFKGSGFYITDYRSEGYKEAAKKETDAGSKSEKSDKNDSGGKAAAPAKSEKPAASSESKAASKTEAKPAKSAKGKD